MPESPSESLEAFKNPETIAVCTTTFYPKWYAGPVQEPTSDKIRGDLALQTLNVAKNRGHQLSVVDGGSSPAFQEALRSQGIDFEMERVRGMSPSRRQAFAKAEELPGVEVIAWTEPEKFSFLNDDCLALAAEPVLKGEVDIAIPARTEEGFASYPEFQAASEHRANRQMNSILRSRKLLKENEPDLDLFFGTRVFANRPEVRELFQKQYAFDARKGSELHEKVKPEQYSDATFFPVTNALEQGLRVKSVTVPYRHPAEQTAIEQNNPVFDAKRNSQRRGIVTELIHLLRLQKNDGKSRLKKVN